MRELKDMLGKGSHFSMDYVVEAGLYVVDEQAVHEKVSEHFREWFTSKERSWGFLAPDCDYERLWSDKSFFMAEHAQTGVPTHLLEVIWSSMKVKRASLVQQQEFEESLRTPPTLEEFESELAVTSRHSSSGPTGVTYNAIAGWPRDILVKVHSLLVEFWNDSHIPRCWKWRWLVPIPKRPDNVTL